MVRRAIAQVEAVASCSQGAKAEGTSPESWMGFCREGGVEMKIQCKGVTPTFPELRDAFIPSIPAKTEPPRDGAKRPQTEFLHGFSPAEIGTSRGGVTSTRLRRVYDDYIASATWREKREPILARAGGCCERCHLPCDRLEVHHRTYERFGGRELPDDLEALCSRCHQIADNERREELLEALELSATEVEESAECAAFDSWMVRRYGDDWQRLDDDTVEREQQRFQNWRDRKQEVGE